LRALAHSKDAAASSVVWRRYSFIGLPAEVVTSARRRRSCATVVVETAPCRPATRWTSSPTTRSASRWRCAPACRAFAAAGGLLRLRHGALHREEARKDLPARHAGLPDILLLQCEELAVIDNLSGKLYLIVYADPAQPEAYSNAKKRLRDLKEQLKYSVSAPVVKPSQGYPAERDFAKADYLAAVERAKELIAAGDFMQVQVGQRIKKRYTESPLSLYRALRSLNPSALHVLLPLRGLPCGGRQRPRSWCARSRPMKASRRSPSGRWPAPSPRGATPEQDKAAEVELVNDPKERAEHVMLIDLARNDIGRIAKIGSVKVTEAFAVERYSHVMHIVSNVEGILNDGMTSMDVLKATFPAGTLTGAPKVHAMEVIDQLEPTKRGLYGGACGYLSYAGDMDVAIAIRTGIIKDGTLYVQAAAGVVADSVPEMEWKETEHKARALLRAAELVEEGLE
jgi:anthranilate synthase component 1